MTITLAPGYVLSRSKEKINVTITDTFFKEGTTKVSWLSQINRFLKLLLFNIYLFIYLLVS